jgi:hypothetical protein
MELFDLVFASGDDFLPYFLSTVTQAGYCGIGEVEL